MNKTEALRILVAAQDDPVLAAWASVVHEYRMPPTCDVSPYDHLSAFEEFFSHGLITPHQYNQTDTRLIFFSGRRPAAEEIQRVLDNLRMLPEHFAMEQPPMSKTKFPDNPFSGTSALTTKGNGAVAARPAINLPAANAAAPLSPFAPAREIMPREKRPTLEPFSSRPSLKPHDHNGLASGSPDVMGDIDLRIFCCGTQLSMTVADMQAEGPDSIPGGQVAVIDRVLHGTCSECHREHHHSVAEVVAHDQYR